MPDFAAVSPAHCRPGCFVYIIANRRKTAVSAGLNEDCNMSHVRQVPAVKSDSESLTRQRDILKALLHVTLVEHTTVRHYQQRKVLI